MSEMKDRKQAEQKNKTEKKDSQKTRGSDKKIQENPDKKVIEELKTKLKDVEDKLLRELAENDNLRKNDNWRLVNGHFRMTSTQVIDVIRRTVRSKKNEASISFRTRIQRLTLSKQ